VKHALMCGTSIKHPWVEYLHLVMHAALAAFELPQTDACNTSRMVACVGCKHNSFNQPQTYACGFSGQRSSVLTDASCVLVLSVFWQIVCSMFPELHRANPHTAPLCTLHMAAAGFLSETLLTNTSTIPCRRTAVYFSTARM